MLLIFILLAAMGCSTLQDNHNSIHDSNSENNHHSDSHHSKSADTFSQNDNGIGKESDAELTLSPKEPIAGQITELSFELDYSTLLTHHARKLHVIIIGEDFSSFAHLHPADFEGMDESKVEYTFPAPGKYLVAIDYHTDKGMLSKKYDVMIGGNFPKESYPVKDSLVTVEFEGKDRYTQPILFKDKTISDYSVSVQYPKIKAGHEVLINYHLKNKGAPVKDFSPYLSAPMHFSIVREDLGEFIHTHGGPRSYISQMQNHENDAHDHSPPYFGPSLDLLVTFPESGKYVIFGQLHHSGNLLVHRKIVVVS